MSRNFGLGSKPPGYRLPDKAYIPLVVLAISVVMIGLDYLFGG